MSFEQFRESLARELAREIPASTADQEPSFLHLRIDGRPVRLLHFATRSPHYVHVVVTLEPRAARDEPALLAALLARNLQLAGEMLEPSYGRDPASGELRYQCRLPIALDAKSFLHHAARAVSRCMADVRLIARDLGAASQD